MLAGEMAVEWRADEPDGVTATHVMTPRIFGEWEVRMDLAPGRYLYRFLVDGEIAVSDFSQPDTVREADESIWSVMTVPPDGSFSNFRRAMSEASAPLETFARRITYRDPRAGTVRIAGTFNQWSPAPMRRGDDGVWNTTVHLPVGSYGYKFVVDRDWVLDPAHDDRILIDGVENSRFDVVAGDQPDGPVAMPADGEVLVTFRFHAPLAPAVSVVGTFNDWRDDAHPMTRRGAWWEATVALAEGEYEYKFKVGDQWLNDPNCPWQPLEDAAGNSILRVASPGAADSVMPVDWSVASRAGGGGEVLFASATRLHGFQQELMRQYLIAVATEQHGVLVADGTLLRGETFTPRADEHWSWAVEAGQGIPVMRIGLRGHTYTTPLWHPLTDAAPDWLAGLRAETERMMGPVVMDLKGPEEPPPDSLWAEARAARATRKPLADVFAVNAMTRFGREHGWSRTLLRDVALAYADLARDLRYPSISGWAPNVMAARAVVYADLARGGAARDETLAAVLVRIGRPGDAAAWLPDEPVTLDGQLAAAVVAHDPERLLAWAGTPDQYGLAALEGVASRAPAMEGWSKAEQVHILDTLADLLESDQQVNAARAYREGMAAFLEADYFGRMRAFNAGGVSAGHRHARALLQMVGCTSLWHSVLAGRAPELCMRKVRTPVPGYFRQGLAPVSAEHIEAITALYTARRREALDTITEPLPAAVRLGLLRDTLNIAWWHNARFMGNMLASREGSEELNRLMASWRLVQPEMDGFTRYMLRRPMNDHAYSAMSQGLKDSARGPDTFAYIQLVRASFRTWLLKEAQRLYPSIPYVQSDLLPDIVKSEGIFSYLGDDHRTATYRRLAPRDPRGYPEPGVLPGPDGGDGLPDGMLDRSFRINRTLASSWAWQYEPEAQDAAIAFLRRSLALAPYETGVQRQLANLLMSNGRWEEALALVHSFADTTEGLELAAMQRLGAFAAVELGDMTEALNLAGAAAQSGQGGAMLAYGYLLERAGNEREARAVIEQQDNRYDDRALYYYLARRDPVEAQAAMAETLAWLEQFDDLEAARKEKRFIYNELKEHPFYYGAVGRWDRALWLLKPLAEAVQNDYIWFLLLVAGEKTGDQAAGDLARHVLANHVQNAFGAYARFQRGESTWGEVINYARSEGRIQPIFFMAGVQAERRGDQALAIRMYKQAVNPRYGTSDWFTLAWTGLREVGGDPMGHARRSLSSDAQKP
jgi:hypothetical protein